MKLMKNWQREKKMTLSNESQWKFYPGDVEFHPTEKKINSFRELKKGWHYGEGNAPGSLTLLHAIELHKAALNQGFIETDAFPGISGEVMLTIYHRNHYLEFTIEPSGHITFCYEKNNEEICYKEGLSLEDAKGKILELRKEVWKSLDYLTSNTTIMTEGGADLTASHLKIQEQTRGFLSLVGSAYSMPEILAVGT